MGLQLKIFLATNSSYVYVLFSLILDLVGLLSAACLSGNPDYDAAQPSLTFTASPFPYITRKTEVYLSCEARSKYPRGQSYITDVSFYKDGKPLHSCKLRSVDKKITLSCNTTLSDITSTNVLECFVRASGAPCNFALLQFKVNDPISPVILNQIQSHQISLVRFTCVAIAFPDSSIKWIINDNITEEHSGDLRDLNKTIETTSQFSTTYDNLPMRVQCLAQNEVGQVTSKVTYAGYIEVHFLEVTHDTVDFSWQVLRIGNTSINVTTFEIELKNTNESYGLNVTSESSRMLFRNLSLGTSYVLHIFGWSAYGNQLSSAVYIVTTIQSLKVLNITSQTAMVRWDYHLQNEDIYGKLFGFEISLSNQVKILKSLATSNATSASIGKLLPSTTYAVVVRGYNENFTWIVGNWTTFRTLDQIPSPDDFRVTEITVTTVTLKWRSIPINLQNYEEVLGYRIVLSSFGKYTNVESQRSQVFVQGLLPNINYQVTVRGYSSNSEGAVTQLNFTTRALQNDIGKSKQEQISTAIVVSIVSIVSLVVIIVATICTLKIRRSVARKSWNVKQEEIKIRNSNLDANLEILFPEYASSNLNRRELSQDAEKWEIPMSKLIVFEEPLGGGHFGIVKKGVFAKSDGEAYSMMDVAVKTVKDQQNLKDCNELLCELEILKHVNSERHPNIISLVGACTITDPVAIILEYCCGGNLHDCLLESRVHTTAQDSYQNIFSTLNQRQLISFAAHVADGMIFLGKYNVVHRDLATRNILMDDTNTPKISDFGLARKINDDAQYIVKTSKILPVKWLSLESLEEGVFTIASDVWSYGVLLWEICTLGNVPYPKVSPYDILDYLRTGHRMSKPWHCGEEIFSLMESCWATVADERPTFQEIYDALHEMLLANERVYVNVVPVSEIINSEKPSGIANVNTSKEDVPVGSENFACTQSQDNGHCDTAC